MVAAKRDQCHPPYHMSAVPPRTTRFLLKRMSRYLPKRDELSFISVWALPKAS